jgi:hypothetical protein
VQEPDCGPPLLPTYIHIVKENSCYVQQDALARNKPDSPDFQQISKKDINACFAIRIQVGHDYKTSVKLYWAEDELYHVPSCSSVMQHNHFSRS